MHLNTFCGIVNMWVKSAIGKGWKSSNKLLKRLIGEHAVISAVCGKKCYSNQEKVMQWPATPFVPKNDVTLWQYLTENAAKYGNMTAVECGITGKGYSFTEVVDKSERLAAALHRKGVNKDDVVCVYLSNCPEMLLITLACCRIGVCLSPASNSLTADELSRHLQLSGAKIVFSNKAMDQLVKEAIDKAASDVYAILTDDGLEQLLQENIGVVPHPAIDPVNDVAILPFSSGTTGVPKGVMLTHSNVINNIEQQKSTGVVHCVENTENFQSTVLGILPLYHCYGTNVIMIPSMRFGNRHITLPKFEPDSFVNALQKYKFHVLFLVPPLIQYIVAEPRITPEDLREVYQVTTGAAPLGKALGEMFLNKVKNPSIALNEGYGLTETSPVVSLGCGNLGSIGKIVPGTDVKIIDTTTSQELQGPHKEGQLCVRGPQVMKGYLNNPEANRSTLIDGWLHTGDVAYHDEDGYYYITGRSKELIKVKGMQVSPSELEDLLRKHPGVTDVGVIGVPDERSGELPRAFIVKKDPDLTEKQVMDFLHPQISKHKYLDGGVFFIDAIPKNPTGKILRRILKEKYL